MSDTCHYRKLMIELMFIFQPKHSSDGGSSTVFSARGKKIGNLNGNHLLRNNACG